MARHQGSSSSSSLSNPIAISLSPALTTRLDWLNFLAWKSQVLLAVTGHGLESFLFYPDSPPKSLASRALNLDFTICHYKDQLLSWLRSSWLMPSLRLFPLIDFFTSKTSFMSPPPHFACWACRRLFLKLLYFLLSENLLGGLLSD